MKILIIGGTGNISTPITRALLERGHDLTLFNYDAQPPEWLRGAKIITGDRTHREDFRAKLGGADTFDCVIDMICYEPEDARCDIEIFRGRTHQFIFCSTVDVYTKTPQRYPVTEENGIVEALPSFPYAHKKMQCEQAFWEAHRRGDFALTVCRPTFTYNEAWSPGIHSFGGQSYHLDLVRRGKPIILHRDGQATGGYAKIATVSSADLDKFGQMLAGDELRFQVVSREEALSIASQARQRLNVVTTLLGE